MAAGGGAFAAGGGVCTGAFCCGGVCRVCFAAGALGCLAAGPVFGPLGAVLGVVVAVLDGGASFTTPFLFNGASWCCGPVFAGAVVGAAALAGPCLVSGGVFDGAAVFAGPCLVGGATFWGVALDGAVAVFGSGPFGSG